MNKPYRSARAGMNAVAVQRSGPIIDEVSAAVNDADLAVTAVLSGNRNFEGRIAHGTAAGLPRHDRVFPLVRHTSTSGEH